jgi:alcohol dehydrogenase class IV
VVLDVRFAQAMPAAIAATSGLDALCQCIESHWSVGATPESRAMAAEGGRLIAANLESSVRSADRQSRWRMLVGAHLSGCAINVSRTTAAHAFSYGLTQCFGVPHGHAVALAIGWVAAWNAATDESTCLHPEGASRVRTLVADAASWLDVKPDELTRTMTHLIGRLGLASTMAEVGVREEDFVQLAQRVDNRRMSNNPRKITSQDILNQLHRQSQR